MATFENIRRVLGPLEAVEERTIHGAPALYVRGKLIACPAIHKSAEPNSIVVRLPPELRSSLVESDSGVYYITEHYAKYSYVLVRLDRIDDRALQELLVACWKSAITAVARARKGRRD